MEEHDNELNSDHIFIIETPPEMSRKRKQRPEEWKCNIAKKLR